MGVKIYGLKNCDKCRKALKVIKEADEGVEFVDVRADGLNAAQLGAFETAFGDDLLNKRSTTWRSIAESDKAMNTTDLITKHPAIMKRPIIEKNGQLWMGWSPEIAHEITT